MPSTDHDRRPSARLWLVALVSLVLPIVGVGAALYGAFRIANGAMVGWAWLAGGIALLIVDLVVDQKWARWTPSTEPDLNRRGAQLIGQVVTVVEAISRGGRGSVAAADTVWAAEGIEAPTGARVRVAGCNGTVLVVGPV
jgi:membrane protein implicated in regulation of membrane protease activity